MSPAHGGIGGGGIDEEDEIIQDPVTKPTCENHLYNFKNYRGDPPIGFGVHAYYIAACMMTAEK